MLRLFWVHNFRGMWLNKLGATKGRFYVNNAALRIPDRTSKSSTQFTFLRVIPTYSASSASCWLRSGRNPYEKPRKSSSQIWVRTTPIACWTTLSSSAAIPNGRCLPPPFLTTLSFATPCRFIPALSARLVRSTMAPPGYLLPHRPHRADCPQRVPQAGLSGYVQCRIRGGSNG